MNKQTNNNNNNNNSNNNNNILSTTNKNTANHTIFTTPLVVANSSNNNKKTILKTNEKSTKRVVFSDRPDFVSIRTLDKVAPVFQRNEEEDQQQQHDNLWYSQENLQSIQRENKGILKQYCGQNHHHDETNQQQPSSGRQSSMRGLEALFSKRRQQKRKLFLKGFLQMQNQLKAAETKKKHRSKSFFAVAKELRMFTYKFTKYARDRARAIAISDATEAKRIYEENCR